jgi:hypothetical protein
MPFAIATLGALGIELLRARGAVLAQAPADGGIEVRQLPLTGLWTVRFELDEARGLGDPPARAASGEIAIRPPPPRPPGSTAAGSVHPGAAAVDLSPIGIALASRDVLAWRVGADSVRVLIDPVVNGGGVLMRGVIDGAVITGRWTHTTPTASAGGRFVMRRAP